VSAYAPHAVRPDLEKEEFYYDMTRLLSGVRGDEKVFIGGDLNGHVGQESDGFEGVHGGNGYGMKNTEGEMVLEFAMFMELVVCNTFFKKDEAKKITYTSGKDQNMSKSEIDYILVRKEDLSMIQDVTVINGEECVKQHKLLLCKIVLREDLPKQRKAQATDRCKIWNLKKKEISCKFREEFKRVAAQRKVGDVDSTWKELREGLVTTADRICGRAKQKHKRAMSTWWNDEVSAAINKKRSLFWTAHKSGKPEDEEAYRKAKKEAKKAVALAKSEDARRFAEMIEKEDKRQNVFRAAKQLIRQNKDVTESSCIKDGNGRIITDGPGIMRAWKEYFDKLLNEEFAWDKNSLTRADAICGPSECITPEEVKVAMKKMKPGKAAGPSGVVAEMLIAGGEDSVSWLTILFNRIICEGKIPDDWKKSWMVTVYKGKGDSLECGSYRGIKLLDHAMKICERVIEGRVRSRVCLDGMQFGFSKGKGTTDAIFIVRQLQERYLCKKKELWMAFVDLEKAFDRVPREILWWSLRKLKVDEWLVKVIQSMYDDVKTAVKVRDNISEDFDVKVGVHQGSVLSPLLFIIVLDALSMQSRCGLPWELLYADDLVLIAESEGELLVRLASWKEGLELKGLKVNVAKTKVLKCSVASEVTEESGKFPCGVCGKGVRQNSIKCIKCEKWVHNRCRKDNGKIKPVEYNCPKCSGLVQVQPSANDKSSLRLDTGVEVECVDRFCYLGDMISANGGAGSAAAMRVRSAWCKFNELLQILTAKGVSLHIKGKIYKACVQRVMVYGSETWPVKVEDIQRLERTERMMMRWMCGVRLKDRDAHEKLRKQLGVDSVSDGVRVGRLRWFGHVMRKSDDEWVKKCQYIEIASKACRGRSRKVWRECVNKDMKELGLREEDVRNKDRWRRMIFGDPSETRMRGVNRR